MDIDANNLALFARVAEAGSFTRAAERAGLPKSTVSRRVAELEQQLGERLFARSTRKLALTDFGRGVLEHARRLLEESEAAAAFAQHRQAAPRGRLRVSLPPDFGELVANPLFTGFVRDYPEVMLELDVSARRVDLLAEQFDLAVRITERLPDDATLVARRLAEIGSGLYASPDYLAHRGPPLQPADLSGYTGLHLVRASGEVPPWALMRGEERWQGLPAGPLSANSVGLLCKLAVEGMGIVVLSDYFARPLVEEGKLVRVLPDWCLASVTVWAVMPGRKLLPAATRAFVEALARALAAGC